PQTWSEYQDASLQTFFRMKPHKGSRTNLFRYDLLDTRTGKTDALIDAPAFSAQSDVLWSPESKTVLLSGVFLPLNVTDLAEREARKSNRFVVAIQLSSRAMVEITRDGWVPFRWDLATNTVHFHFRESPEETDCAPRQVISYRAHGGLWEPSLEPSSGIGEARPCVFLE